VSAETPALAATAPRELTSVGRWLILAAAFFGWLFAGVQMTTMSLAGRSATIEFLRRGAFDDELPSDRIGDATVPRSMIVHDSYISIGPITIPFRWPSETPGVDESKLAPRPNEANHLKSIAPRWIARYNASFLLGAALGGLLFGWIGDWQGRVRAMALSIVCYTLFTGAAFFAATPESLLALRFLTGLGVGGMWPTGVSLASEAWSDVSRPLLAGVLGTAANVGIVAMGVISWKVRSVTADDWRWVMVVGALPFVLGVLVWALVPESPNWLAGRGTGPAKKPAASLDTVFRPPLLSRTVLGVCLGIIPMLGGWGATQWMVMWSEAVAPITNPEEKAFTIVMRAAGGTIGSLIGGWVANQLGRRTTYFVISLVSWGMCEYIYLALNPQRDASFQMWVFAAGFVTTIFFGWLPLYLPELFPTAARATGTGVSFNFGRIATAFGVLWTGWLVAAFHENYSRAGSLISLIYAAGLIVILFAPDTTKRSALSDQPSAST
jgi:MFS family permease